MPASRHGRGFDAKATPQHNVIIAQDEPIPEERRNKTPNLWAKGVRWYICTTAPSRELSAAASVRRIELCGARAGETPFLAYVPCEFSWRRSVRSNLRVPRREQQRPIMRSYLFLGVLGGLCDVTLAALRERDIDQRNVHGLTGILGSPTAGPLRMNAEGLRWMRQQGEDELAGRTNLNPLAGLRAGDPVRAGSGMFSGFAATFVGTATGGTVGVVSIAMMGSAFNVSLPIEDVQKTA
jgi:transcription termination/antitermination protein NusG